MRIPRLAGWMIAAVALAAIVAQVSPQQVSVIVYKGGLVTLAAVLSYWLDRSLFGESAQPRMDESELRDLYGAARIVGRALVYLGTVLGMTLGL